ncbi:MAG: 30S ribosomal protein S14 [Acidobacteriota bacterium]
MAKKSKIAKNEKRKVLVERYRERREALKKTIKDPKTSPAERWEAAQALRKLPRDSSPVRVRNRCALTGRCRGYNRRFGMSRIALRELALRGLIPGVTKASW